MHGFLQRAAPRIRWRALQRFTGGKAVRSAGPSFGVRGSRGSRRKKETRSAKGLPHAFRSLEADDADPDAQCVQGAYSPQDALSSEVP